MKYVDPTKVRRIMHDENRMEPQNEVVIFVQLQSKQIPLQALLLRQGRH